MADNDPDPTMKLPDPGANAGATPGAIPSAGELLARALGDPGPTGGGRWVPPTPEELSALLPQYRIEALIGHGGMGAVYKGVQAALKRPVAIKLLPLEISADPAFARRFEHEAQTLARLSHPNIVSVYDFGTTAEGHLYFVMEFVEGTDLHQMIRGPGLSPAQALGIIVAICEALQYAHGKGVVHRDIKPANVMVNTEGTVKVADFGLARLSTPDTDSGGLTMTGTVMGTPAYMAPEQTRGMNVDHRADIYSLGVMLYEMLCGEIPRGVFDPPSHKVQVDVRLDEVVIKAMQSQPERRYQNTVEMKTDVDRIRTTPPSKRDLKERERKEREKQNAERKSPRGRVAAIVAACLILAGAAATWLIISKNQPPASVTPPVVGTDWTKAIDLLALIAPEDAVQGTWSVKDGVLFSDMFPQARVQIPYEPPEEYDYRVDFSYSDTDNPMLAGEVEQYLSKGGRPFRWIMGAERGNTAAFELINGKNAADSENPTRVVRAPVLTRAVPHTSIVEVRNDGVRALLDGEVVAEWKTHYEDMGTHNNWALHERARLGIGSYQTAVKIEKLRVFEVTGKGRITRAPAPRAAAAPAFLPKPASVTAASATKDAPFVNTLGMKFVPVPILGGPTNGQRVLFSIWETRVQDYEIFAKETKREWLKPIFAQEPTHPAVNTNWHDAAAFCTWLTARDRQTGRISGSESYRLPNDHEWSCAVGIGEREDAAKSAADKHRKIPDVYPWGNTWPPPAAAGNFSGEETARQEVHGGQGRVPKYRDAYPRTAPVGSFPPNQFGLYDLSGNVWEMCDALSLTDEILLRGGSFDGSSAETFLSSSRDSGRDKNTRGISLGFRVVLAPVSAATPATPAKTSEVLTFAGHRYQFVPGGATWQEAKAKAEALGGHLATLTSKEEADWLSVTFGDYLTADRGSSRAWLGGFTAKKDQPWQWVTGEPFTFTDWLPAKPSFISSKNLPLPAPYAITLNKWNKGTVGWSETGSGDKNLTAFLVEWDDAGDAAISSKTTPAIATKDAPFVNSLGMKFVPVPITGGPTGGPRVLFSVWHTRVQDYAAFAKTKTVDDSWQTRQKDGVPVAREPDHPVAGVNWTEAQAFCRWLTETEIASGKLPAGAKYRLPTDAEWSAAAGLPAEPGATPAEKHRKNQTAYPWGLGYPPPKPKLGNFADSAWYEKFPTEPWLEGYADGYATTSPVGSFPANAHGLYDMGGNLWQWCEDWRDDAHKLRLLRGASWFYSHRNDLLLSHRHVAEPTYHSIDYGFRCVLESVAP